MSAMETIAFSSGAVARVRVMPPHVYARFLGQFEATAEPEPEAVVKRKTVDGRVETHPLTEDMPEYAEWQKEWEEWAERNSDVRKLRVDKWNDVVMDYCVVDWRWGEDGEWISDVPPEWEFSPALIRGGVEPSENERVDYLQAEIVVSNLDHIKLRYAVLDRTGDLSNEEVQAQLAGFLADMGEGRATTRGGITGNSDLPEHVSRGDGNGSRAGNFARRLVRWVTGR